MKPFFLLLFFTCICYTQKREAIITFVDSTTFEGYAELTAFNRVKFRLDLEDEPDKLGPKEILQVEFVGAMKNSVYRYVRYEPKGIYMLLKVIEDGELALYAKVRKRTVGDSHQPISDSNFPKAYSTEKYYSSYYLHRQDKAELYLYKGDKTLLECFSDCNILKQEIVKGNHKERSLQDLVWEYNYECGGYN